MPRGFEFENWLLKKSLIKKYGAERSVLTGVFCRGALELSHFFHNPRPDKNFYLSEANAILLSQIEHFAFHLLLKKISHFNKNLFFSIGGLTADQNEFALSEIRKRVYKNDFYFQNYDDYYNSIFRLTPQQIVFNLFFCDFLNSFSFCEPLQQNLNLRNIETPPRLFYFLNSLQNDFNSEI